MANNKRETFLDIAKGIAIVCIVLLHIEEGVIPNRLNVFIGSFMISLFFVTTGWLDAQRIEPISLNELIKKRWKQLAIPYFWWSGLILLFDSILWAVGYYDSIFMMKETYKTVVLRGCGTLWFLPALFGGEIIWNFIRRKHSVFLLCIALIFTEIIRYVYADFFENETSDMMKIIQAPFFTFDNMLSAWIGIAGGFAFRRIYQKFHTDQLNSVGCFIIGICLCIIAYYVANDWPFPVLWDMTAPIIGPVGVLLLCKAVERSKMVYFFNYWGINSMSLMVTHYSFCLLYTSPSPRDCS